MNAIAQASPAPVTGPKLDNRRVAAGIVDLLIVAAGAAAILFAADALTAELGEIQGALGAVILGWALYYHFALESGGGQTVGKKLMKLRVVRVDGSPVGMREVAVRTILRVIDGAGAYIVGLIVMLGTGQRRQRIGDLAAGTIVVDASGPATMPAAPAVEPADATAGFSEPADEAPAKPANTITLPARPAPPATLSDLAAPEAPAVPELRPFPPVGEETADEPEVEEPVAEEEIAEEPLLEEPLAEVEEPVAEVEEPLAEVEEPVAEVEEPIAEEEEVAEEPPVQELAQDAPAASEAVPVADEPVSDEPVADEPAEELPELGSPVIDELAEDVAAAQVAEPADDEPVEDEPAEDEPINVKSVETVSAIDLVMGGAAEDEGSSEPAQEPEDAAS